MMKGVTIAVLVLMMAGSATAVDKTYGNLPAQYLKNYDGDTITVTIPGVHPLLGDKISVRVRGIDTPENRGKCQKEKDLARTGQRLVESMLKNAKAVTLENVGRGKYFRIVADVVADGKSVGAVLLKNNLAVAYDGGKKIMDWCQ